MNKIYDTRGEHVVSVLVPVRNDDRIHMLLDSLARQPGRDKMCVLIMTDSSPAIVQELPDGLPGAIWVSEEPLSIAQKMNRLILQAETPWVITAESDTVADDRWLVDVLRIIGQGYDDCIHLGGEIRPKAHNLNNVLWHKTLNVPPHDDRLLYANDGAWFEACKRAGIRVLSHDREALLYHDQRHTVRFVQYAHDFGCLAAQRGGLGKYLVENLYYIFRGLVSLPILIGSYAWYRTGGGK